MSGPLYQTFSTMLLCYFLSLILVFTESKEKKTESCRKDEALGKVDCLFGEIQGIMKQEKLRIQKEKEAFDSVAKKLKHVHFSSTAKLNVGGQIFTTSLQTLTKDAGSMLHAMFSGRFDTKPAEDGSYFIDRDGTHFRYILNYLRMGKLLIPENKVLKKEVLEEAKFYQIQGIVDELEPKFYDDSVILSSWQADWLKNIHGEGKKFSKCNLLYRASRDGWLSSVFHAKCDPFKRPTMVVIKSTKGYIFGGYTEQNWFGVDIYKSDHAAFLFSLVNPEGTAPVKMKVFRNPENAVFCDYLHGPIFGGRLNGDLVISINHQSNECSVNIGQTYELPLGQSSDFLTGGKFKVAELEVFGLEKD